MTSPTPEKAYQFLKERFAQVKNLTNAGEILGFDMQTTMQPGSSEDRVNQLVALNGAAYTLISDPRVEEALDLAETDVKSLSAEDRRNLQLMRHHWVHDAGLPEDLAREQARVNAEGERIHVEHYKGGDWSKVAAWYEHSFNIMREVGEAKKDRLGVASAYEALLDHFSPGLRASLVEAEFKKLDTALRVMIPEALQRQAQNMAQNQTSLDAGGPFPAAGQVALSHSIVKAMGFDTSRGVLAAIPGHPSSCGSSDDNRITTRVDEDDYSAAIYGSIHEAGHGIYEQNLPRAWRYQPAGGNLGMAVHESQSMVMEYQACMTAEFLSYLAKRMQEEFNRHNDPHLTADHIRNRLWHAKPSFIRVEADVLTYPMHVMLRHDLESKIIGRQLDVKDLPDAWNDGMQKRLGITPPDASKGCIQDVHWPAGLIGYFPAYTLGAMGAAQFFAAAVRQHPTIPAELGQGNFTTLKTWLHDNVHSKGSLLTPDELFKNATGTTLNADAYMEQLSQRYLGRAYNAPKGP